MGDSVDISVTQGGGGDGCGILWLFAIGAGAVLIAAVGLSIMTGMDRMSAARAEAQVIQAQAQADAQRIRAQAAADAELARATDWPWASAGDALVALALCVGLLIVMVGWDYAADRLDEMRLERRARQAMRLEAMRVTDVTSLSAVGAPPRDVPMILLPAPRMQPTHRARRVQCMEVRDA